MNNKEKRETVKRLISEWRENIISLQETKLEGNIAEVVNQMGRYIDQTGLSGS